MERLTSIDDFKDLQDRIAARQKDVSTIIISAGTCGQASGANDLIRVTKRELLGKYLTDKLDLRITGCHGWCEMEPSILVEPDGVFYPKVAMKDMARIVMAVCDHEVINELLYQDPVTGARVARQQDIPFFKRQTRVLMARNEAVDPIRIYNYLGCGGYAPLLQVLEHEPQWTLDHVKTSKIRGRGGAGFPTGAKWQMLADAPRRREKLLVCNADEGDPGAYMDRSLLEGNPQSIIEGMVIGGYATGATRGVIYVRAEYPLAIKHLIIARRQALELGLLGEDILGSGFSFDIDLVKGAGAFVCGEETALMRSIEGRMGEPRQRPPFPIEKGVHGQPTSINNVETWANIPVIIEHGGEAYAKVGTANSSGTKIFSLVGKIRNTGLVEVPMGMTIKEIITEIGGGPLEGARIKAVQTGGPSGGCIPASRFDLPIDYDSLKEAGSIMGSGGMIVMDDNSCMVDLARYFMNFLRDESCGKCFICRKGTQRMYEILDDITKGQGTIDQLALLEELATVVQDTSMCGLGQSAPNPVLSTLRYFRTEYEHHLLDKRCEAMTCQQLVGAPCQATCPIGTEAWRYVAHLAKGEYEQAYAAIRETNPLPSICARVCDHKCETYCRLGTSGANPVAIRALKRFVTDRVDPSSYEPAYVQRNGNTVAVVGTGPAGLTAAHALSVMGYKVTLIEADSKPGGMLLAGVPTYRLPRKVLEQEINAIIDGRITLRCDTALGKDITIDQLFDQGHKAVFLGLGAHRSRRLHIEGEDGAGVYPSMRFLKDWNLRGKNLALGNVGIIGGGNSAVDAARVARRQEGVKSVTILYRRTRDEMPAFEPEVKAALKEGVMLKTLVSPTRIHAESGALTGVEFLTNELGALDASGRRRPLPVTGSEHVIKLDTLIVAIGEQMQEFELTGSNGLVITKWGTVEADPNTLQTGRPGVFAGGDAVTGPNTVIDAMAAGKKAAVMMDRHVRGEDLRQPEEVRLPRIYVEAQAMSGEELAAVPRADLPMVPAYDRRGTFLEVERCLHAEDATREARRCLRCDLEFTQPKADDEHEPQSEAGGQA